MRNILILDDPTGPSLYSKLSYSEFISAATDHVRLLIITASRALSDADKRTALRWAELESPSTTGRVEILAAQWHAELADEGGISDVYTKQEDLILRASYLRHFLGIGAANLQPAAARLFRDKVAMKERAQAHGVPVPAFRRVYSPSCVLEFVRQHGLPVVLKPVLGSASASVHVFRTMAEVEAHLADAFYERIDSAGRCMDYSGDMIIEQFVAGTMYHANGYARGGEIQFLWPFQYLRTNLDFAHGEAYGNVLVSRADPRYARLLAATRAVLQALPCPEHLVFHLELFEDASGTLVLCEIAARRPGGSIGSLISAYEGGANVFHELEFRCNLGLAPRAPVRGRVSSTDGPDTIVGDLIVPHRVGILNSLPPAGSCPTAGVTYVPVGQLGTVYRGFSINVLNTAARFTFSATVDCADARSATGGAARDALNEAAAWFRGLAVYSPLESSSGVAASLKAVTAPCEAPRDKLAL